MNWSHFRSDTEVFKIGRDKEQLKISTHEWNKVSNESPLFEKCQNFMPIVLIKLIFHHSKELNTSGGTPRKFGRGVGCGVLPETLTLIS